MPLQPNNSRPLFPSLFVLGVLVVGAWLWASMFVHVRAVEATVSSPVFQMGPEPLTLIVSPDETVKGRVRKGQSIHSILSRYGVSQNDIAELARVAKPIKDLSRVHAGQGYRIRLDETGAFRTFELDLTRERMLRVTRTPFGFVSDAHEISFESRQRFVSGSARGSLFADLVTVKGGTELTHRLHDLFAWQVDFNRDIRNGDDFKVVVDEVWRDGEFDHFGTIHFAQIQARGRAIEGLLYDDEYYDSEGNALRSTLLPAPVDYRRISSHFSKSRWHPVHGNVRPHLGVDLVAPYGAPVRAAGNGTVSFVGWKGDNGRLITVRHAGAYRTAYAHLARFADGVKRGTKVRQGQVIGYVGNSGTSTGTHLHYGVYRYEHAVNPLALDYTPVTEAIDLGGSPEFQLAWDAARLTLTRMEEAQSAPIIAAR